MKRPCPRSSPSLSAALALAACGEKQDQLTRPGTAQSLTLMLDWFPNADHVGLYEALADGDFATAGLDVHVAGAVRTRPRRCSCWRPARSTSAISYEPRGDAGPQPGRAAGVGRARSSSGR